MNEAPAVALPHNQPPSWLPRLLSVSPALLLVVAAVVSLGTGLLVPSLGPIMLIGYLGIVGGVVSVLRPGIGLFFFSMMMYSRASEVLTTSLGVPSIAPLFTIWLLTGVVLHFGIGGLFHARPTGWQALVIYGLVLLASTLVAANPWASTFRVVDYVRELVYIALIVMCVRQINDLRIVVRAMVIGGTIPGLLTIWQTITGSTNDFLGFGRYSQAIVIPGEIVEVARPAGMIGDPNFYAMALIAVIPLAMHRWRWERSRLARQLMLCAAVALAVASIMTYSRGGYLTLAVVIGCLVVAGYIRLKSLVIVGLIVLALLPVMPDSYSGRITSILEIPRQALSDEPPERGTATDTSVSGRVSELMSGVHMFLDHPILGVGTNNYPTHYQEYARPMGVDRRTERAPHSLYVEIAAETGIVGIVAFSALVLTLFTSLRKVWTTTTRGNELHDLAIAVAIGLLSVLVASVFLHFAYQRYLMVFAALTLAVVSVQNWRAAPASRLRLARLRAPTRLLDPVQRYRISLWGGVAGICVAIMVASLILGMSIRPDRFSFGQDTSAQAIQPPLDANGVLVVPTPTPVRSATPTPEPTPAIDQAIQAQLLSVALSPAASLGAPDCIYDAQTQHNICGNFAEFFTKYGGEAIFGSPLSEQYIVDGKPVQYFERARFEWHPGSNGEPAFVLLSRLGAHQRMAEVGQEIDPPALPNEEEGCIYEDQTGHNTCGDFAFHWVSTGGPMIYGFPITEPIERNGVQVQYFERARFESRNGVDGTTSVYVAPLGSEEISRLLERFPQFKDEGHGG